MVTGWQASGPTTGPGASVAWPLKLGMLGVDRLKNIDQKLGSRENIVCFNKTKVKLATTHMGVRWNL